MAIVPDRNEDQVKVTGASLTDIVQHRECFDGGLGKLERRPGTGPIYTSTPGGLGTTALGTMDPKTGFVTPIGDFFGNILGPITEIEWSPDGKTLYATSGGGDFAIYTIDAHSGEVLTRTPLSGAFTDGAIQGLEFDQSGTLLGTHVPSGGGAAPSTLVSIVPATGVVTSIGLTGIDAIGGLAFHRVTGILYGVTSGGSIAELVTIDPGTGVATSVGFGFGIYGTIEMSSLEFDAADRLISGGDDGNLYEIDTTTGLATLIGPLAGVGKVSGLSMRPIFSGPRVHDLGITERDHVAQSAQRALRQDVKKPGGSPGLVPPKRFPGLLFPTGDADKNI